MCVDDSRLSPHVLAGARTCIDCGVKGIQHSLKSGDMVAWDGYRHVMCKMCEEFKSSSPRKALGICQKCWDISPAVSTYGRSDRHAYRQAWEHEFNLMQLSVTGSMQFHHGLVCRKCYKDLDKCPSVKAILSKVDRTELCRLCLVKTFGCCPRNYKTGNYTSRTVIARFADHHRRTSQEGPTSIAPPV